jgi:RNA polymerase sigma-54 factor
VQQKAVLAQKQELRLSPQLLQSIRLMALPIQELKEEIQLEIERNPALEIIEEQTESVLPVEETPRKNAEIEEYFEDASDPGFTSSRASDEDEDSRRRFIEGTIARPETLQEHLIWQLRLQPIPEEWRSIGELLIQNLDGNGFHKEPTETLFKDRDPETILKVKALIQALEPPGTCTADYHESLLIQTRLCADAPEGTIEVLEKYLEPLEKGKFPEIARKMKLTPERMERITAFIKTLNPFPGRQYSTEAPTYVIPDVMVTIKEGEFVIILNDEEIPVLGINPFFRQLSDHKTGDKKTKEFLHSNINGAKQFIQSIRQRNQTLLRVMRAIVEFQRSFFMRGPKALVPLTLRDIAQEIGVHETTVSRIAHSKYVQTDWGIFELRYFFSNSISGPGSGGSQYSKTGVKELIREIIEQEARKLSDQDITDLLEKRGIALARRTVAKYRKELLIQSSFNR